MNTVEGLSDVTCKPESRRGCNCRVSHGPRTERFSSHSTNKKKAKDIQKLMILEA